MRLADISGQVWSSVHPQILQWRWVVFRVRQERWEEAVRPVCVWLLWLYLPTARWQAGAEEASPQLLEGQRSSGSAPLGLHHAAQWLPSQRRSAGSGDAPNNILPCNEGSCLFAYSGSEYSLEGECLCGDVLGFGSKRPDRTWQVHTEWFGMWTHAGDPSCGVREQCAEIVMV